MKERRNFLKMVAAAPAGALVLPWLAQNGGAAEAECCGDVLCKLPENLVYTAAKPGVWKGKEGGHLPKVECKKKGDTLTLTVKTDHGMGEDHYIVRHTVVSDCGKVLGAKTFSPGDEPVSSFDIKLTGDCKHVFVTSYCSLHDLWIAHVELKA